MHGERVDPSPWVEILKAYDDPELWAGLSAEIEFGKCECEVYCTCR